MLGLSSMMLVIGLVTEKRNAAEYNQTKWILDAAMIGWCAILLPRPLAAPLQHAHTYAFVLAVFYPAHASCAFAARRAQFCQSAPSGAAAAAL